MLSPLSIIPNSNDMALKIFYFLLLVAFLRALVANISMGAILLWLRRFASVEKNSEKHFFVVIPVLREQKVISETVHHFLRSDYPKDKLDILIVTTERELADDSVKAMSETTLDVVEKLKKEAQDNFGREIVQSIHYPDPKGKMVDQLNFAFKHILGLGFTPQTFFVAIYNADSRPHRETFSNVSALAKNEGRVFQQSALFLDNWEAIGRDKPFFEAKYLQANAILQSRWTLAHEMPRFFRQSYFLKRWKRRVFLSHCVGHGLFLRGDLLEEVGSMPEGTLTEDLFFGFVLSLLGEPIQPVPVLEVAETPADFFEALKQKYVWFFGPFDHFHYSRYFSERYQGRASWLLRQWFVFQGVLPAFAWAFQGWIFLYLFVYPLISGNYGLLWLSFTVFLFHSPLSYVLMLWNSRFLFRMCSKAVDIHWQEKLWSIFFSFPAVVLHSLPPMASVYAKVRQELTGREPKKPKTER